MKVIYPGPKVEGETRTIPTYYGALGIGLSPGENEIEDAIAEKLLKAGQVELPTFTPAPKSTYEPRGRFLRREKAEEE